MLFIPAGGGWTLPAGSGDIKQRSKGRQLLRKRTIQHTGALSNRYLGSNLILNPAATLRTYNNTKLRRLAEYWDITLTGAQRSQWDALAPAMMNGFDFFMSVNLTTYQTHGVVLPIFGQNIGDITTPADWQFEPPVPTCTNGLVLPGKNSLNLTFTGNDRFTFTSITGNATVTARAELITMYSTRPFQASWNEKTNPLIRLGQWIAAGNGQVQMLSWPNLAPLLPLKTLFERVIGGATSGQKLVYGYRFNASNNASPPRNGIAGPLRTSLITVL